ncbi:MAG: hypothetical protein GEV07_18410 [Streptosporangiales bacterium]|nr:hypothetical protein [Streptosporangiales bacterium]
MLRHERVSMVAAVQRGVDGDPYGVTLAGVIRQLFVALEQRPLVKAFMLRDREVIGKLLRQAGVSESKVLSRATLVTYLEVLHARGLVRTDLSVSAQVNLIMATITGFLLAEPVLLDDRQGMVEDPADVVADVIGRALDPGRRLTAAEQRVVEQATREYVEQVVALSDAKYQSSLAVCTPARRRR